jgi:hypothetical protein
MEVSPAWARILLLSMCGLFVVETRGAVGIAKHA